MRTILSVILLVVSFSLDAAPPSIAPDTPMLAQVYELSQAPIMLRYAVQKRNMLKNMGQAMAAPRAQGLDNLLDGVLNEPDLDARARQYLAKNWDFQKAPKAATTFQAGSYARLLTLEAQAGAPTEKEALRAYFMDPGPSDSDERIALIVEIDQLVFATEWMSAFLETLAAAIEPKLKKMVATRKVSQADYDASVAALRKQATEYRDSRPGTLLLMYAYRQVSTAELEVYRDALDTDEGQWLLRTSRQAVIEAMKPSISKFADNLAKVL